MLRRSVTLAVSAFEYNMGVGNAGGHMGTGFGGTTRTFLDSSNIVDAGVERTVLDNGVTVVTHDKGLSNAAVGFFADAGVKYDPATAPGLTHMARMVLLSSNMSNSLFQVDRAFRAIGAAYGHSEVNKRYLGAWAVASRAQYRVLVDELAPAFAAPRFAQSDAERYLDNLDAQREETRWLLPRQYAVDELETVAFYREPLGNPRMAPPECVDRLKSGKLLEKYCSYMAPNRVTVVGVNVNHQDLVAAYEGQSMPHSADAPHHKRAAPAIEAGDEKKQFYATRSRFEFENRSAALGTKPDQDPEGTFALGFLSAGADESAATYAAALVYRQMVAMNVGEALTNPSKQAPAFGLQSFYRPFSSAGLVGVTARGAPSDLPAMLEQASKLALPTDFNGMLNVAKTRALNELNNTAFDSITEYAEFLGTSKYSAEELISAVSSVEVPGVNVASDIARSQKPVLFAHGDVMHLPTVRQIGL